MDGFQSVKYADDSSCYLTVPKQSDGSIILAIHQTQIWSNNNNMQLNTDKTSIVNFYLTHRQNHCDPVHVDNNINIER